MKILGQMNIKPGNLLKDEELKTFRGGQQVECAVYFDGHYQGLYPFLCYGSQSECDALCASAWSGHTNPWCFCNYGY
jgi:hypothetical protein